MADIGEKQIPKKNSSTAIVSPPLSVMGNIDPRPQIGFLSGIDSKQETNSKLTERRSNQTFTPPTSSLSNQSSSNDLHLVLSSISVDLPPLNYAIEKFLIDDGQSNRQIVEELPPTLDEGIWIRIFFESISIPEHLDSPRRAEESAVPPADLHENSAVRIEKAQVYERRMHNEQYSSRPNMSKSMKWYVSELRINRPLIYQTSSGYRQEQQHQQQQQQQPTRGS